MRLGIARRALALSLFAAVLGGCSTVFLQDDGFSSRIPTECPSEKKCDELVTEAEARVASCKPNTVGYVRCDDARADLFALKGLLAVIRSRREDLQRQQTDAIRAKEDARKARRDAEEAEREEAERQAEKQRAKEAREAEAGQARATLACSGEIDRTKCDGVAKPADCRAACEIEIAKALKSEMSDALSRCIRRYVADSKAPVTCAPGEKIAKEAGPDAIKTCAVECKKAGPAAVVEIAQRKAAEAREAAAEAMRGQADDDSPHGSVSRHGAGRGRGTAGGVAGGGTAGGGGRGGGSGRRHRPKRR